MRWLESWSQLAPDNSAAEEEMVDDEDFYGNGEGANTALAIPANPPQHASLGAVQPGVPMQSNTPMPASARVSTLSAVNHLTAEQRKIENQKKAEQLRAKLIANRRNTPNRSNTPNRITAKNETHHGNNSAKALGTTPAPSKTLVPHKSGSSSDVFGVNQLLQEGKAAAEAKAREEDMANTNAESAMEGLAKDPHSSDVQPTQPAETQSAVVHSQHSTNFESEIQSQQQQLHQLPDLATEYYADLAIWLEVTGYHDIDYRNSKLRTYKERKALEEEAARIQEKLEKLKEAEQAEMAAMRGGSAYPVATPRPPSLALLAGPSATSGAVSPAASKPVANGVKRAHSPDPMRAEKNARPRENTDNGIRIRGANDSPQDRVRRPGGPLGRRVSYPDARRQDSFEGSDRPMSRDPSLERRQAYYGRDGDGPRGRERFDAPYPPRENGERGRMGFGSVNVTQDQAHREPPRGIRDVDVGRGANVKYFMIKSWNADNVAAAMRDSLWSTQVKNEQILADAYDSSHAVVLCFSVNNSKAFQGYALMASPPTPSLPKPAFCARLNWPTSPAFRLAWLATSPVHFRRVGHIKNALNVDEDGRPSAVLVGKDGQEIDGEAGRRLCEILDEGGNCEGGRDW